MWSVKNFSEGFLPRVLVATLLCVGLIFFPQICLKFGVDLGPIVKAGNALAYVMLGFNVLLLIAQGLPRENQPNDKSQA